MERPVIILHSLLVLLATFHIATGCMCRAMDLDSIWCNPHLTVIRAKALKKVQAAEDSSTDYEEETLMEPYTIFQMQRQNTFKTGRNEMEIRDSMFEIFPEREGSTCEFDLEIGADYLLVGDVNDNGEFSTSLCLRERWEDLTASQLDLLEGNVPAPNCDEDSELPDIGNDIGNDEDVFLS